MKRTLGLLCLRYWNWRIVVGIFVVTGIEQVLQVRAVDIFNYRSIYFRIHCVEFAELAQSIRRKGELRICRELISPLQIYFRVALDLIQCGDRCGSESRVASYLALFLPFPVNVN